MPVELSTTRVSEVMTRDVVTVSPGASVREAARLMAERNVGALPVVGEGGRLVGILSERDIVRRVVAAGRDPDSTRVSEVMTPDPVTVRPDYTLADALRVMAQLNVRHLPVVDEGGRLVGIISVRDIEYAMV